VCVINAYSGALSGITWDIPLKRVPAVVLIGAVSVVLSVAFGGPKFESSLEDFLFLVAYFVTPWLAVVIIDFWGLNRGAADYPDVSEFYKRNGVFGTIRWAGLLSFLIGVAVSVPFMATVLYTGPIGKALGGADISYGVSAVVAGAIYYVWGRQLTRARRAATVGSAVASPAAQ
jgi:nucleobase:cation symporter-1, NCS1 family